MNYIKSGPCADGCHYNVADIAAYEYVADSEECRSESTMSSIMEATQQTLTEPDTEEAKVYDEEGIVMMADVQWCLRSLVEPQQSEVASQFSVDCTDRQKLTEHELSVEQLITPNITGRTETHVVQQTPRSVEPWFFFFSDQKLQALRKG